MQGNILLCYPAIFTSQVILPSDVISVGTFHALGNILSSRPALLPTGDGIAVSAVAVVRIRYNKTIVALVRG